MQGQSRTEIEKKKKALQKEILNTNKELEQNKQAEKKAKDDIQDIEKSLDRTLSEKRNVEGEVYILSSNLSRKKAMLQSLSMDLKQSRESSRGSLMRLLSSDRYKNWWIDVVMAGSLIEWMDRKENFKMFIENRKRQISVLNSEIEYIETRLQHLQESRVTKEKKIKGIEEQKKLLAGKHASHEALLVELDLEESKLRTRLGEKQKAKQKLDKVLKNLIEAEIAKRAARKKTAPSKASLSFADNKGNMDWPLFGDVIRKFGKQAHPSLKNILIQNNGVDISSIDNQVLAVHAGKVISMQYIPGNHFVVIMQHGQYYTVYSNLDSTEIRTGDNVVRGQAIGKAIQDSDSRHLVHFEIWDGKKNLNPSHWLAK